MTDNLQQLSALVADWRARNSDVFFTPSALRCAMYAIEELTEAVNAYDAYLGSDHLRSEERQRAITDDKNLYIEVGQALFMLVSMANEMGITNLDLALQLALDKLDTRCATKRASL